jgi:hypothetical protein
MLSKKFPKFLKKNGNSLSFYEKNRLASFLAQGQTLLFVQRAGLPQDLLAK